LLGRKFHLKNDKDQNLVQESYSANNLLQEITKLGMNIGGRSSKVRQINVLINSHFFSKATKKRN